MLHPHRQKHGFSFISKESRLLTVRMKMLYNNHASPEASPVLARYF
jgi:hypothetical protein